MKKSLVLFLGVLVLSGCTTYTVKRGEKPYDKGYVVARRGFVIPEYTIGENNSVPDDLGLAKERLKRRRKTVDYYYEKLGDIDSNFKSYCLKPMGAAAGLVTSPFRLPVVVYQDHKYAHNPAYREKMDKINEQADKKQRAKIKIIREYMSKYIQDDLSFEKELMAVKGRPEAEQAVKEAAVAEVKPDEVKIEEKVQVAEQPGAQEAPKAEEKPVETAQPAEVTQPAQEEAKKEEESRTTEQAAATETVKPVQKQAEVIIEGKITKPEEKTPAAEVTQPAQEEAKTEEAAAQAQSKEEKMAEELARQEEEKAQALQEEAVRPQEKPAKVSMWQKMKNIFKHKEKPAKTEEVVQEEPEEKPVKVSMWQKMKNAFKPKEKPAAAPAQMIPGEPPVAIIVARPVKGYSPLKVHFSASRSRAAKGKIVSYEWDFGDQDKSKKPSAINTFYSGTFEPKQFTVTLTVQDDRGNVGIATTNIEVLNK
jgi:DNA polymerase III gamma/tau subunit